MQTGTLKSVSLTAGVFHSCCAQAISTEREEVMGLLLGDWIPNGVDDHSQQLEGEGEHTHAEIRHILPMTRTDRRKDRVEVSYEQLAMASTIAESLTSTSTSTSTSTTRVIGWFHSHPHITVLPSHVDVLTQGQYQQMDTGWVGLIVSVYSHDARSKSGQIQIAAFQSFNPASTSSMQGGEAPNNWQRLDVPLRFVESPGTLHRAHSLGFCLELQQILFSEERQAYLKAVFQRRDGGGSSSNRAGAAACLQSMDDAAVYQRDLCRLMDSSLFPLLRAVQDQKSEVDRRLVALRRRNEELRAAAGEKAAASARNDAKQICRGRERSASVEDVEAVAASAAAMQVDSAAVDLPVTRLKALRFATRGSQLLLHSSGEKKRLLGGRAGEMTFVLQRGEAAKWVLQFSDSKGKSTRSATIFGIDRGNAGDHRFAFLGEGGERIEVAARDGETYRMWQSVAKALFPQAEDVASR